MDSRSAKQLFVNYLTGGPYYFRMIAANDIMDGDEIKTWIGRRSSRHCERGYSWGNRLKLELEDLVLSTFA